jgi:hypothetical protein
MFVSVADLPNLAFTPVANSNGNNYATFTFQVADDGGTANGGIDLDPSPKTLTINVTPVNDPPVGATNTVTLCVGSNYTFAAADFGFTDPNDNPPNCFNAVRIKTIPATPTGTLTLSGTNVLEGDFVPVADLPNLLFTPAANACGSNYATITFQVEDDGGTNDGGVNLDPLPKTLQFDVFPLSSSAQIFAVVVNSAGTLVLSWTGDAGGSYWLEYADDFGAPVWTAFPDPPTRDPGGFFTQEDSGAVGAVGRFYRVKSKLGPCR